MTFRQMELFILVCEQEVLIKLPPFYSYQQSISKIIKELEDELSCKLLHRSSSGFNQIWSSFSGGARLLWKRKLSLFQSFPNEEFPKETIYLGMAFGVIAAIHIST